MKTFGHPFLKSEEVPSFKDTFSWGIWQKSVTGTDPEEADVVFSR